MADTMKSLTHKDYTVGWICALPTEFVAAQAMLDERHQALPNNIHDQNNYALGRIGKQDIAIACLPKYQTGTSPAAIVANTMLFGFPSIRFGLMVGIGGGVPSMVGKRRDLRLGDIVVSAPTGVGTGVVQYDMGKTEKEGQFRRTGALNKPPPILLTAISSLETQHGLEKQLSEHISSGFTRWYPDWASKYAYQGADCDRLFEASYDHIDDNDESCQHCDGLKIIARPSRCDSFPVIHYGNIASGNQVMKHGITRDQLAERDDVICFEMEAAGLMDSFPCLVIRGICDYADSHKNKKWQPYSAATAAAYAKALLLSVAPQAVQDMARIKSDNHHWLVPRQVNPFFTGRRRILETLEKKICTSFPEKDHRQQRRFVIVGMGGIGKSEVCLKFAEDNRER